MDQQRTEETVERERFEILSRLERWLEWPMIGLAFLWLALLIVEFVYGQARWLETFGLLIWVIFIADFFVRFLVAPRKTPYLKSNWLTAISLLVPALRVFRVFALLRVVRVAKVARGLRLIRVVGSVNRGMGALGRTMRRRGFGYVLLLTIIVTVAGAAGMFALERDVPSGHGLRSYGAALWWTAMVVTTMGTDYWPQTTEGRFLCFLLAIYAFAVFGYVTATIATFFIGRDAENNEGELAGQVSIEALRHEIASLREELKRGREERR